MTALGEAPEGKEAPTGPNSPSRWTTSELDEEDREEPAIKRTTQIVSFWMLDHVT